MDSGSSVFVIPSGWLKMFPQTESEGSRAGVQYNAAGKGGRPIPNEGQKVIDFKTSEGKNKKMVCQVANMNKILASISGMYDKGSHVLSRADGGDMINIKTTKKTPFRRHGNIYVLDAWIERPHWKHAEKSDKEPSAEVLGFARHGERSWRSVPIL